MKLDGIFNWHSDLTIVNKKQVSVTFIGIYCRATTGTYATAATGRYATAATTGRYAPAATTGRYATAATTGRDRKSTRLNSSHRR